MRLAISSVVLVASAAFLSGGCVVRVHEPVVDVAVAPPPPVVVEPPIAVVEGPGVFVVEVDPPIEQRVYVYEQGYPPGVYLVGGFYFYGGHRYERDVFINRVVHVNIQRNLYVNVEENRRVGARIVEKHKVEYAKTGGHRAPPPVHKEVEHKTVVEHKEVVEHKPVVEHKEVIEHKDVVHKEVEHKEVVHKEVEHKEVVKPERARPGEKPKKPGEEKK